MNIDVLNKKRKGICALSLTLTIVIIVIGAFMLILGMYNTFFFILAPIFIIVFLYLLSKFLIIPKYETLRINIIEEILKNRNKNYKIIKSKEKFDELKNYYDYKQLKLSSKQQLTIKNIDYSYVNFELLEKSRPSYVHKKLNEKGISCTLSQVELSIDFIRSLDPYPAREFFVESSVFIGPDVLVRQLSEEELREENNDASENNLFIVELVKTNLPVVKISKDFLEYQNEKNSRKNLNSFKKK